MTKLQAFARKSVFSAVLVCVATAAGAQQIPASSVDSGSRAVVAIDQQAINNSINNAYNTANWGVTLAQDGRNTANYAVSTANNAQNTANYGVTLGTNAYNTANYAVAVGNDARNTANYAVGVAQHAPGSVASGLVQTNINGDGYQYYGICVWGMGYGAGVCPSGSGFVPTGAHPQAVDGGGDGGGTGQ